MNPRIVLAVWRNRRLLIGAVVVGLSAAMAVLLVFVVLVSGGTPTTDAAALQTPECAAMMSAQGVDASKGIAFGPGPVNNGKAVIAAGIRMRIPEKGIIVALATALQESSLKNLANPKVPESLRIPHEGLGYDHESVGIFQQQPWWGSIQDLMTPAIAAAKFFTSLLKVGGWQQMAPTVAAQAVQRSRFPDAYADDVPTATLFYRQHLPEVLAAAGSGTSAPEAMGGDDAETLCQPVQARSTQVIFKLSQLPPGKADEHRLQRYTILANRAISAAFPQIKTIGGYRPDALKWHPEGLALDVMVSSAYPPLSPQGIALGNGILAFFMHNAKALGIAHAIWRQHMYYPDGHVEAMEDRGGLTANHFDHVHVGTIGGGYP